LPAGERTFRDLSMKRWALVTILLYGLLLVLLTEPVITVMFLYDYGTWEELFSSYAKADRKEIIENAYLAIPYWVFIGSLLLIQALLLAVPVRVAQRRPVTRRRLLIPILVTGALFSIVLFGIVCSIAVAIGGDEGLNFMGRDDNTALINILISVVVLWTGWTVVFYRFSKRASPERLLARMMRTLLTGSILEVLVAVPCHVVVRHREDCCAPIGTFFGIATGLIVMLASFGPGVFFLFVERARRLMGRRSP